MITETPITVAQYLAAGTDFYTARAAADALISPVALGPLHWVDLLAAASHVVVSSFGTPASVAGEVAALTTWETEGSNEADAFDNLEILVSVETSCYCSRPCCSGSYTASAFIGWDGILALYAADGSLVWGDDNPF